MDIKILKEITKLMKDNDLMEVEVESADLKIRLKKSVPVAAPFVVGHALPQHAAASAGQASAPATAPAPPVVDADAGLKPIISPIPGTVYLKPNPDTPNFVAVGTQIDDGKVVCLVEAMKVFNEIKPDAGTKGVIKKILVQDGQAVEYGTVLFLVG